MREAIHRLKHRNVINLIEVWSTIASAKNIYDAKLYLIFDYCEYDLARLLQNNKVNFGASEIKNILLQLFTGLHFLHSKQV